MEYSAQTAWSPRFASRADRMQASEIRELLKLLDKPDIVSFAGGVPDPALFPRNAVSDAYQAILADPVAAGRALQYSISEGDPALRDWIASHMKSKGVACARENILVTNGSQQGLEFLGRLFISPGDTALVTSPTYLGALQAFGCYEPNYDDLGLVNTNRTASSYQQTAADAGGDVKFAYVVPDFANPTGETLNKATRQDLLSLAGELDIPVIEDSPYSALRYEGEDVMSLQGLDLQTCGSIEASRVIHCGSFSKVFTPGLRVGWVCASQEIIGRLTLIKQASDLNSPAINQAVMFHLANTLFDKQVAKAIASYRIKRDAMLEALAEHLPQGTTWSQPEGGLFIWVTLPDNLDAKTLLTRAVDEAGVAYVPGHAFHADGSGKNTMRLSFSLPSPDAIKDGIARLAAILDRPAKN